MANPFPNNQNWIASAQPANASCFYGSNTSYGQYQGNYPTPPPSAAQYQYSTYNPGYNYNSNNYQTPRPAAQVAAGPFVSLLQASTHTVSIADNSAQNQDPFVESECDYQDNSTQTDPINPTDQCCQTDIKQFKDFDIQVTPKHADFQCQAGTPVPLDHIDSEDTEGDTDNGESQPDDILAQQLQQQEVEEAEDAAPSPPVTRSAVSTFRSILPKLDSDLATPSSSSGLEKVGEAVPFKDTLEFSTINTSAIQLVSVPQSVQPTVSVQSACKLTTKITPRMMQSIVPYPQYFEQQVTRCVKCAAKKTKICCQVCDRKYFRWVGQFCNISHTILGEMIPTLNEWLADKKRTKKKKKSK